MSDSLKIVKLVAENVKRLHAVEITPSGDFITIGGRNKQGKSSVLDAIAMAIGGKELVPPEPIHGDEKDGFVEIDLGDYVVTRRFKRDIVIEHGPAFFTNDDTQQPHTRTVLMEHICDATCKRSFGETRSSIVVKSKDGAAYAAPQTLLDKLVGQIAFDPLAFTRMTSKDQDKLLRRIVNLDTTPLENRRAQLVGSRQEYKRRVKMLEAQLKGLPQHQGVPLEEQPLATVTEELARAEELATRYNEAIVAMGVQQSVVTRLNEQHTRQERVIFDLEDQLRTARENLADIKEEREKASKDLEGLAAASQAARDAVPDTAAIRAKVSELELTNRKVRDNKVRISFVKDIDEWDAKAKDVDDAIEALDEQKEQMLRSVTFPVPGLGFSENGITLNGKPFEQASTAEQLQVSVAIGIALNPRLKVLLVRDGNHLDEDSLKQMTEQAAAAGMQVWMEWVTKSADGVSVLIEDGYVAS